jgi:hypothetical protein
MGLSTSTLPLCSFGDLAGNVDIIEIIYGTART